VAFSPDLHFALSGGADNTIRLWEFDWEYDSKHDYRLIHRASNRSLLGRIAKWMQALAKRIREEDGDEQVFTGRRGKK
jgi:hypothetical protein